MTTNESVFAVARSVWGRASRFPIAKEDYYPEHADAQEFDRHTGKTILDYGCGGGPDTMSYLRRKNFVIFADIVPENIHTTMGRVANAGYTYTSSGLHLKKSDEIPVESGCCDVVSSHGVLHHIPDPIPVLQEFKRILKPDGELYIMLYTEHLWKDLLPNTVAFRQRTQSDEEAFAWATDGPGAPYATYYTEEGGTKLLAAAGFKVTSTFCYHDGKFRTYRAKPVRDVGPRGK